MSSEAEWADVPDWPGYRVSSDGVVQCCRPHSRGDSLSEVWRVRSQYTNADGYKQLSLHRCGKSQLVRVHSLVLIAFVGRPPEGQLVRHRDGNRSNNRLTNLQWGTPQDNADDREIHGTTARGERGGRAKLSLAQIESIKSERRDGKTFLAIATRYGVSKRQIGRIVHGFAWIEAPRHLQIMREELLTVEDAAARLQAAKGGK